MMKSVLISIKPKWCELIVSGKKTIEVRKTRPKLDTPFKCYIYETLGKLGKEIAWRTWEYEGRGQVIGEFVCNKITHYPFESYNDGEHLMPFGDLEKTCLDGFQIYDYLGTKDGYGWYISDLKIYDEPKELSSFYKGGMLSYDDWLYGIYNGHGGATSRYESYKKFFSLKRPPQSWCYVEECI